MIQPSSGCLNRYALYAFECVCMCVYMKRSAHVKWSMVREQKREEQKMHATYVPQHYTSDIAPTVV